MEVILREDYPSLGHIGDKVSVKSGYFRNYLAPKGIAVEAQSANAKRLAHVISGIMAKRAKKKSEAEEFAKTLKETKLEFILKLGAGGKSFGSITSREIEAAFKKEKIEINRKQIRLPEPIKSVGTHTVDIKVHAEVMAPVTITVVAEKKREAAPAGEGVAAGEPGPRGKGRKPRAAAGGKGGSSRSKKASEGETNASDSSSEKGEASE